MIFWPTQTFIIDTLFYRNRWLDVFTSTENRHALPLFTSLLNTICGYDPYSSLVPLNHLLFEDSREPLVEVALQLLIGKIYFSIDHNFFNLEKLVWRLFYCFCFRSFASSLTITMIPFLMSIFETYSFANLPLTKYVCLFKSIS